MGIQCLFCKKEEFRTRKLLVEHMTNCRKGTLPKDCPVCGDTIKTKGGFYTHIDRVHPTKFRSDILKNLFPNVMVPPINSQGDDGNAPDFIDDTNMDVEETLFPAVYQLPIERNLEGIQHEPTKYGMVPSITAQTTSTLIQSMLLTMRANNNCTIELVDNVANNLHSVCYNISSVVVDNLLAKALKNQEISPQKAEEMSEQGRIYINKFLESVKPLESEYGRRKYLQTASYLVEPRTVRIRDRIVQKLQGQGLMAPKLKSDSMQIVCLKSTLENWFSNPNVSANLILQSSVQQSDYISTPVTANYMQWIYNNLGEDFIAIELHGDDFDPNNALGPHKKVYELCVISGCVKNMNEMYQSANICKFLLAVGYSSDMEVDHYDLMQEEIVKEFEAAERVKVVFHDEIKEMPVVLFFYNGDYLAIKKQLGWSIIWHSGRPCNVCEIDYENMLRQHVANPALRRDVASHDSYVEKAKTEINKAYRGVKFLPKIVNRDVSALKFFHPATNMCLDLMHMWDEGKAKVTMYQILRIMIFEESFFTMNVFNEFIDKFPVGQVYRHLRLATITISSAKERNKFGNLKPNVFSQNAAEMHFLVRMFGFIIAQLVVNHEDNIFLVERLKNSPVFKLWISLAEMQSWLYAPRIPRRLLEKMARKYDEHCKLRNQVVPDLQEIFKDHPGVHVPEFIETFGMPTYYKSNMYEATYANMKSYCHFNKNHINVPYSTARSHEYARSVALLQEKHIKDRFICPKHRRVQILKLNGFRKISERLRLDETEYICVSDHVTFGGTNYEKGMSVLLDFRQNQPYLGCIEMFVYFDNIWLPLVQLWKTKTFVVELQMFEVELEDAFELIQLDQLKDFHPLDAYPFARKTYVALPYMIFE